MGLLLYFLVVVYAFNTHYWLSTAREEHGFAGAVVLNAGFVVIMLAALLTNDVLGLPVSLIPLALSLIHISEPTRLLSLPYAAFCLKKKIKHLYIQLS